MSQRSHSVPSKRRKDTKSRPWELGERVMVNVQDGGCLYGILRFEGQTHFSEGEWLGIELEQPKGKNNGSVQGVAYFQCDESYGLFVRPINASRITEAKSSEDLRMRPTQRMQGSIFETVNQSIVDNEHRSTGEPTSRSNDDNAQKSVDSLECQTADTRMDQSAIEWFRKIAEDLRANVQTTLQSISKDISQGQAGLWQNVGEEIQKNIQAAVESILGELRQQFVHSRQLKEELLPRFNTLSRELQELKEQCRPFKRVGAKVEENSETGRPSSPESPKLLKPVLSNSPLEQEHRGQKKEDAKSTLMGSLAEQTANVNDDPKPATSSGDGASLESKAVSPEVVPQSMTDLSHYLPQTKVRSFEDHEKTEVMLDLEHKLQQLSADSIVHDSTVATYASILHEDSLGFYKSLIDLTSIDSMSEAFVSLDPKQRCRLDEALTRPISKEKQVIQATPVPKPELVLTMSELIASLGGQSAINMFRSRSAKIAMRFQRGLQSSQSQLKQPTIYLGLGLSNMLAEARLIKEEFDELVSRLVEALNEYPEDKNDVVFRRSLVKSLQSVAIEVSMYHDGDCCKLKDVISATVEIKAGATPESLDKAYRVLERLVDLEQRVFAARAEITHFFDRYLDPVEDCREWVFYVRLAGVCCELKVNLAQILCCSEGRIAESMDSSKLRLLEACALGDVQMAGWLLRLAKAEDRCSIVEAKDRHGQTVLHYAARLGQKDLVSDLLQMNADFFASDQSGVLALHHATVMGHTDVAKELLTRMESNKNKLLGLPSSAKLALQHTWCIARARTGNSPSRTDAEDFARRLSDVAAACFRNRSRQLRAVVACGDTNVVKCWGEPLSSNLASQPPVFHPHAPLQCTCLDDAVLSGSVRMVQCLQDSIEASELQLSLGGPHANVQVAASAYARQNDIGCLFALLRAVEITKQVIALPLVLLAAIEANAFDAILSLVRHGVRLTAEYAKQVGDHLVVAIGKGDVRIASALIEAGVPATHVHDASQLSVLHFAAAVGDESLCRSLVGNSADVNLLGGNGVFTPVTLATCKEQRRIIQVLVELKADLNIRGDDARASPLGECCLSNMPDMIDFLVPLGLVTSGEHVEKLVTLAEERGYNDVVLTIRKAR